MEKSKNFDKRGFTLVEILIVIGIIGILSSIILVSLFSARGSARDARRKIEISQIGRFLTVSCYLPDAGPGTYDLVDIINEIIVKNPQYKQSLDQIPKDPKTGSDTASKYFYIVSSDGKKCSLYTNLENSNESVTLTITVPTPGGGTGVLRSDTVGWNGTNLYYQYSN